MDNMSNTHSNDVNPPDMNGNGTGSANRNRKFSMKSVTNKFRSKSNSFDEHKKNYIMTDITTVSEKQALSDDKTNQEIYTEKTKLYNKIRSIIRDALVVCDFGITNTPKSPPKETNHKRWLIHQENMTPLPAQIMADAVQYLCSLGFISGDDYRPGKAIDLANTLKLSDNPHEHVPPEYQYESSIVSHKDLLQGSPQIKSKSMSTGSYNSTQSQSQVQAQHYSMYPSIPTDIHYSNSIIHVPPPPHVPSHDQGYSQQYTPSSEPENITQSVFSSSNDVGFLDRLHRLKSTSKLNTHDKEPVASAPPGTSDASVPTKITPT